MFAWLAQRILARRIPGAGRVFREPATDGSEFAVITRGDSIDVYQGRKTISSFSIEPEQAAKLGWWLLWSWWICGTWFGLKRLIWGWAFRYRVNQRLKERSRARVAR